MQTNKEFAGKSMDKSVEFYIQPDDENKSYILTIFDPEIEDNDEAYIEAFECDTFEEAMESGLEYRLCFNHMKTEDIFDVINHRKH